MGRAPARHCFTINREAPLWRRKPAKLGEALGVPYPPLYPIIKQEVPASAGLMAACAMAGYNLHELFIPMLREDFDRLEDLRDTGIAGGTALPDDAPLRWAEVTRGMWNPYSTHPDEPGPIGARAADDLMGIAGGTRGTDLLEHGYAITWWKELDGTIRSGIHVPLDAPPTAWEALNRRFGLDWGPHTFDDSRYFSGKSITVTMPTGLARMQEDLGVLNPVPWTD